jgi:hypothetical protein
MSSHELLVAGQNINSSVTWPSLRSKKIDVLSVYHLRPFFCDLILTSKTFVGFSWNLVQGSLKKLRSNVIYVKISSGTVIPTLLRVKITSTCTFHIYWPSCVKSKVGVAEHLWVSWKSAQQNSYFAYGCTWTYARIFYICRLIWMKVGTWDVHQIYWGILSFVKIVVVS